MARCEGVAGTDLRPHHAASMARPSRHLQVLETVPENHPVAVRLEERYINGWAKGYADEQVKILRREDFAYHQVGVVFWQTDENDQPAVTTEPYEKSFTAANVRR